MSAIPKVQRAALLPSPGADVQIVSDYPVTQPADLLPGQCLVHIEYSGVCHTDLSLKLDDWGLPLKRPLVCGHEGIGRVVAIGAHTQNTSVKVGDRVGIKWIASACMDCETCRKGSDPHCSSAKLSGFQIDGTFAQYMVSYVSHVTPIPEGVDSAAVSAIMCAGVTVYRAIRHSNTHVGNWIVIPGAGGGLGHLAVQYAVAAGLRVVAIDTGADKKALAFELGAEKWIDFKETKDLVAEIRAATDGLGPHAAVIAASASSAYELAIDYLRPTGYLMALGLPRNGALNAPLLKLVGKGITIRGSYVGSRQDALEALALVANGKVKVKYVVRGLSELPAVYDAMEKGELVGRVVLDVSR